MNRLDLVLINPGNRAEIYQSLGSSGISAVELPVWMGLLANYMLTKGYAVHIIDANADELTPAKVAQEVVEINPTLTAVIVYGHNPSASTQVMPSAGRFCKAIKDLAPDKKVLMLGGHVSALPERTLREESVDYVCTGEGPVTLSDLVMCLKTSGPTELSKVRGLMYKENNEIVTNPHAPNIVNLDQEIPGMPWHMLPMDKYMTFNWHALGYPARKPAAAIYTTLGCPYRCEFCCIQAPFKKGEKALGIKPNINSYRYWSPEFIVKQVKLLVENYGIKHLKFADEMYFLNARHNNAISEGLIHEGLGDWLNIWAYARVDTVKNNKMVDLAIRSGIHWLCLGIESASEKIRNDIDKSYKQDEIFKSVEKARQAGIYIAANYIFGLPEDTVETIEQTLKLAMELNTEWFNVYSAMAYPGSELYHRAVHENWHLPDSWIGYSQHSYETLPLSTKYLTGGQVLTLRDQAHIKYFSNPNYLNMLEKKFGPLAVKNIHEMLSNKLVRKHAEAVPDISIL